MSSNPMPTRVNDFVGGPSSPCRAWGRGTSVISRSSRCMEMGLHSPRNLTYGDDEVPNNAECIRINCYRTIYIRQVWSTAN